MFVPIFANQLGVWEMTQFVYTTGLIEGLMKDQFLMVLYKNTLTLIKANTAGLAVEKSWGT